MKHKRKQVLIWFPIPADAAYLLCLCFSPSVIKCT